MTKAKEIKGVVLCENFNEKFCELLKNNCKPEITKCFYKLNYYLDIFLSSDIKLNSFADEDCGVYGLTFYVDNRYRYRFTFYTYICGVHLSIYDFNDKILSAYTFAFDGQSISSFFNSIQTEEEEENASEPEQPVEDAEEPEEEECWSVECSNCTNGKIELTLGTGKNAIKKCYSSYDEMYEDNPEYKESFFNVLSINARLTPLERVVFEEIENCYERYNDYAELARTAEYGAEYNGEPPEEIDRYGHLANEQIFNSDYLKELISKAGLDEIYQAWLQERKEQKAVGSN